MGAEQHAERAWNVAIRAAKAEKLEIAVYDDIGTGWLFGEGFGAKDFLAKLRSAPKAQEIDLRVNSNGGVVDDARAMVNLLGERAAAGVKITGYVDGIAASSASFLLTAAHRVVMPSNAFLMIHEVRGGVRGRAQDLESAAEVFRKTNEQLAEAYAAASERRGKKKSKADYLAKMASGDFYLTAEEAVDWGLADAVAEPLKVAASLAALDLLPENAPEALRGAPYLTLAARDLEPDKSVTPPSAPAPVAPIDSQPSAPAAAATTPAAHGQENNPMTIAKAILTVLALNDEADESAVVTAINKLKNSAKTGAEIETLLGATGAAAVGAVRGLQAAQEDIQTLNDEVAKQKVRNARRDFESALAKGFDPKERKLTPANAQRYKDKFEAALNVDQTDSRAVAAAADKASEIVEDLNGFLKVATRVPTGISNGGPEGSPAGGPMQFNGKSFEAMTGHQRAELKKHNVDLYNAMREDALDRGAI